MSIHSGFAIEKISRNSKKEGTKKYEGKRESMLMDKNNEDKHQQESDISQQEGISDEESPVENRKPRTFSRNFTKDKKKHLKNKCKFVFLFDFSTIWIFWQNHLK